MTRKHSLYAYILGAAAIAVVATQVFSQGPLTPPGAPAPTMKTLAQIEPRIDILTLPGSATAEHVISQAGSYYLSDNLTVTKASGIEIGSSSVTLDLMGFQITRNLFTPGTADAIVITGSGAVNIKIKNGTIIGAKIANGIVSTVTGVLANIRVSELSVIANSSDGINLGFAKSNYVDHCSIENSGGKGIVAGEISNSTSENCTSDAIYASGSVSNCRGVTAEVPAGGGSLTTIGIFAQGNVTDSYGSSKGNSSFSHGIHSNQNVSNSTGIAESGLGIFCAQNVTNSSGTSTSNNGIEATGNVMSSTGSSVDSNGISGKNISNSSGESSSSNGIIAGGNVDNSSGRSFSTTTDANGIRAIRNVSNSDGRAVSSMGAGIHAGSTISHSSGINSVGAGLKCNIGIGCTSDGGDQILNKYNMP